MRYRYLIRLLCMAAYGYTEMVAAGVSSPALAQASVIEADAPERTVAGCYAVSPPVPPRPIAVHAPADYRPHAIVPDTLRLALSADHYGGIWAERPWRSAGWLLKLLPDPWPGLHSFAHWRLDTDTALILEWNIGYGPGPDYSATVKQLLVAKPADGGKYVGSVMRQVGAVTLDSIPISLTRIGCPDESYFHPGPWMSRATSSRQ